jgi:hypothetical protein
MASEFWPVFESESRLDLSRSRDESETVRAEGAGVT